MEAPDSRISELLTRFLGSLVNDCVVALGQHTAPGLINKFLQTDPLAQSLAAGLVPKGGSGRPRKRNSSQVNVPRECAEDGCIKRPSFGVEGQKARYCSEHKRAGDQDVAHRNRCQHENCAKHPGYGFEGEKVRFCSAHKEAGMVDLKKGRGYPSAASFSASSHSHSQQQQQQQQQLQQRQVMHYNSPPGQNNADMLAAAAAAASAASPKLPTDSAGGSGGGSSSSTGGSVYGNTTFGVHVPRVEMLYQSVNSGNSAGSVAESLSLLPMFTGPTAMNSNSVAVQHRHQQQLLQQHQQQQQQEQQQQQQQQHYADADNGNASSGSSSSATNAAGSAKRQRRAAPV